MRFWSLFYNEILSVICLVSFCVVWGKIISRFLSITSFDFLTIIFWKQRFLTVFIYDCLGRFINKSFKICIFEVIYLNFSKGVLAENILSLLSVRDLCRCESVSKFWRSVIARGMMWKKRIENKLCSDPVWRGVARRREWWFFCCSINKFTVLSYF